MTAAPFLGSEILPPGAHSTNPVTRSWAEAQWARYGAIDPDVIRLMLDPARIPLAFLEELALAVSVDVWDEAWDEVRKRAVVAASPEVHRIKGTRQAVRLALAALNLDAEIVEWWERVPAARRGTFTVTAYGDAAAPAIDLALIRSAQLAVRRAKPKSRVFTFAVGLRTPAPIRVGLAYGGRTRAVILPLLPPPPASLAPLRLAVAYGLGPLRATILPRAPAAAPSLAPLGVAFAYGAVARRTVLHPLTRTAPA